MTTPKTTVPAPAKPPAGSPLAAPTNQQVLALTHAIALAESQDPKTGKPNYNAVGDNGTSHGAYQWQPGNFAAAAKRFGLNPNDTSPENQDKVAYAQVYDLAINKGYNPAQIASTWNSGSPDNFKDHSGTVIIAGKPIHYDTPAYVGKVQGHYQQLIGGKPSPGAITAPPPAPVAPPRAPNLGELDAAEVQAGADKITGAIKEGADKFAADTAPGTGSSLVQEFKRTGDLLETGLGAAAGAARAVFAPITAVGKKAEQIVTDNPIVQKIAGTHPVSVVLDAVQKGTGPLSDWAAAHPEAAKNLADAVTVGGAAFADVGAANPLNTDLGEAAAGVKNAVVDAGKSAVGAGKSAIANVTKAPATAADISTTVQNHLTTGKMIADNTPGIDTQALIENTKKEMVAGLQGEGMKDAAKAVSKLNPADFESLDDFGKAAKSAATPKWLRDLTTSAQTTGKSGTLTQAIKQGRVEEGGVVAGRTIAPDAHQLAIEDTIKDIPGVAKGKTLLENSNAIHDEIGNTAQDLRTQLADRDIQPIVTQEKWNEYLDGVKADIEENPLITGDAQTTADKILKKFQSLLPADKDITATDVLDARQGLDRWIKNLGKSAAFDPKTENAVSIALRATRQGANELIADAAPDVAVADLLRRQSLLFDAIDAIAPKAAKEAGSTLGRILAGVEVLRKHPVAAIGGGYVADKIVKTATGGAIGI